MKIRYEHNEEKKNLPIRKGHFYALKFVPVHLGKVGEI